MSISTIQNKSSTDYLIWKSPINSITIGSQIIVHENEEALLFENGQLLNILKPGRHLVESGNIPGIEGLISRSFKGGSPIIIEIWFASKIASFDYKWGTRLQVKDNTYGLILPMTSFGSYALKIRDAASLIIQLVSRNQSLSKLDLKQKLVPLLVRNLKEEVADTVVDDKADIFTISTELRNISKNVQESLSDEFSRFGLDLFDFYIESLEVDEKCEEYKKLKSSLGDAASLKLRANAAKDSGNFEVPSSFSIVFFRFALDRTAPHLIFLPLTTTPLTLCRSPDFSVKTSSTKHCLRNSAPLLRSSFTIFLIKESVPSLKV